MTEPESPRTGGAHRRAPGGNRLPVLLASVAAIAVAAGLVIFALHLRGEPAGNPGASTSPSASPQTSSPLPTTPAPTSSSVATSSSVPPSSAAPPPPSAVVSPSTASASVSASATSSAPTATAAAPPPAVDVLNDSRISGLAASAAKQLRSAGWRVSTVGNWQGSSDVPTTTVFYPDGDKAAAQRLASQYGISRVLAAPSGLSSSNLTLVLAYDWSGAG